MIASYAAGGSCRWHLLSGDHMDLLCSLLLVMLGATAVREVLATPTVVPPGLSKAPGVGIRDCSKMPKPFAAACRLMAGGGRRLLEDSSALDDATNAISNGTSSSGSSSSSGSGYSVDGPKPPFILRFSGDGSTNGTSQSGWLQASSDSGRTWGSACFKRFGIAEATVACRQMGLGQIGMPRTALSLGFIGSVPKPSLAAMPTLLNVEHCSGSETRMENCTRLPWGHQECISPYGMAGVVCLKTTGSTAVRIVGGSSAASGRVEVSLGDGAWGSVCGAANTGLWSSLLDAFASQLLNGTGSLLSQLLNNTAISSGSLASSILLSSSNSTGLLVSRLFNGTLNSTHSLEAEAEGQGQWDVAAANVVCRQLGYASGRPTVGGAAAVGAPAVMLSGLVCNGNESSVMECGNGGWGDAGACVTAPSMVAGVTCSQDPSPSPIPPPSQLPPPSSPVGHPSPGPTQPPPPSIPPPSVPPPSIPPFGHPIPDPSLQPPSDAPPSPLLGSADMSLAPPPESPSPPASPLATPPSPANLPAVSPSRVLQVSPLAEQSSPGPSQPPPIYTPTSPLLGPSGMPPPIYSGSSMPLPPPSFPGPVPPSSPPPMPPPRSPNQLPLTDAQLVTMSPVGADTPTASGTGLVTIRPSDAPDAPWNYICGDPWAGWDEAAANVACRGAGFPAGGEPRRAWRGGALPPLLLGKLQCDGSEASLSACTMANVSDTVDRWHLDASASESQGVCQMLAAVRCYAYVVGTVQLRAALAPAPSGEKTSTGTASNPTTVFVARLEATEGTGESYGAVCRDSGFDDRAAAVACRSMGYAAGGTVYRNGTAALTGTSGLFVPDSTVDVEGSFLGTVASVRCKGTESNLGECAMWRAGTPVDVMPCRAAAWASCVAAV